MKVSTILVTIAPAMLGSAAASVPANVAKAHRYDKGVWKAATALDSRSPCPLLNTLANHGHLPRDGKNITPALLNSTIQDVLNFEPRLSGMMAGLVFQIVDSEGKIELADLALHGFIEHDASLVHDDVAPGQVFAPTTVNQTKLDKLLTYANPDRTFTYLEFSRARADSEILSHAGGPNVTRPGAFEPTLILQAFGQGEGTNLTMAASSVASIFGKERLPLGFVKQTEKPTAETFFSLGGIIAAKVAELKDGAATNGI